MFRLVMFTLLVVASSPTMAGTWRLVEDASSLTFVTIKKSAIAEVNYFSAINGRIEKDGHVQIDIPLTSVESYIPIRNTRLRSLLFDVKRFPKAVISTRISMNNIKDLDAGKSLALTLKFKLDLHGNDKVLKADVIVVKLANGNLLVMSVNPVIVRAADFGLTAGIEKLREIAGLDRIATSVPVSVMFQFKPD